MRLIEGIVAALIGAASAFVVARRQASTEVMKLRHAIAERRVRESGEAVAGLRGILLDHHRWTGSRDRLSAAGMGASLAAELVITPGHTDQMVKLFGAVRYWCWELAQALHDEASLADTAIPAGMNATLAVQALTEAVDICAEAKLEGRSSRRHQARLRGLAEGVERLRTDGETSGGMRSLHHLRDHGGTPPLHPGRLTVPLSSGLSIQ